MNSETYIDFCFIRETEEEPFAGEIERQLQKLFGKSRLRWHIYGRQEENMDIMMVEIKGMSGWQTNEEAETFIKNKADDVFWDYLQGYQMFIFPQTKGCGSCG
jgi:hypothetical protein